MSTRMGTRLVGAALLVLGQAAALAAKPPELPIDGKVECKEPPRLVIVEQPGQAAQLFVTEAAPIDVVTPCVCDWFAGCFRDVLDWFTGEPESELQLQAGEKVYFAPTVRNIVIVDGVACERIGVDFEIQLTEAKPASACPFLCQQQAAKDCRVPEPFTDSVLENLEKLELAREMFKLGEQFRQAGKPLSAEHCFTQVRQLCPGSQWDGRAGESLKELVAARRKAPAYVVAVEESSVAEGQEAASRADLREVQKALRSLVEVVQKGMDVDVALAPRARVQCELHVSGTMYKVTVDENGTVHYSRQTLTER